MAGWRPHTEHEVASRRGGVARWLRGGAVRTAVLTGGRGAITGAVRATAAAAALVWSGVKVTVDRLTWTPSGVRTMSGRACAWAALNPQFRHESKDGGTSIPQPRHFAN